MHRVLRLTLGALERLETTSLHGNHMCLETSLEDRTSRRDSLAFDTVLNDVMWRCSLLEKRKKNYIKESRKIM